jgi:hypothetical protein
VFIKQDGCHGSINCYQSRCTKQGASSRTGATGPSTATKTGVPSKVASSRKGAKGPSTAIKTSASSKGSPSRKGAKGPSGTAKSADFSNSVDPENSEDIKQLKRKWKDLEITDLASADSWSRGAERGKANLNYIKRLSAFAEWSITKRVKNKMVCVAVGPNLADKMLGKSDSRRGCAERAGISDSDVHGGD